MLSLFKIEKVRFFIIIGKFVILPARSVIKFKIKRLVKRHLAVNFKLSVRISVNRLILLKGNAQAVKSGIFNLYFPDYLLSGRLPVTAPYIIYNLLFRVRGVGYGRGAIRFRNYRTG